MLDPTEVGGAVWLSKENLLKVFNDEDGELEGFVPTTIGESTKHKFEFAQIKPHYPNERMEGLSKAHTLALKHLLQTHYYDKKCDETI
jgi:hypothetical protein